MHAVYEVMIKEKQNGFNNARDSYYALLETYEDDWTILMETANRLAFNGEYQDAIAAYEKAHEKAPKPRCTGMEYH